MLLPLIRDKTVAQQRATFTFFLLFLPFQIVAHILCMICRHATYMFSCFHDLFQ